jgi:hypothetical protein
MMKSRGMRWVGHVAWRDEKCIHVFLSENLKGRDYSEDVVVDGGIIIEWLLGK